MYITLNGQPERTSVVWCTKYWFGQPHTQVTWSHWKILNSAALLGYHLTPGSRSRRATDSNRCVSGVHGSLFSACHLRSRVTVTQATRRVRQKQSGPNTPPGGATSRNTRSRKKERKELLFYDNRGGRLWMRSLNRISSLLSHPGRDEGREACMLLGPGSPVCVCVCVWNNMK